MRNLEWDEDLSLAEDERWRLEQGSEAPRNDFGNGDRFRLYAGDLVTVGEVAFDPTTRDWLFRRRADRPWVVDVGSLHVRRVAHEVLIWMAIEVRVLSELGASVAEVEAHCRHVEASGNSERIDAMIREAAPHLVRKD